MKTILVTIFENGIHSEALKYCRSQYIPWSDIKDIELVKGRFHNLRCYYVWLKPYDLYKYNYKKPLYVFLLGQYTNCIGFNALSIRISFILDVDSKFLHSVCNTALNNYHAKYDAKP